MDVEKAPAAEQPAKERLKITFERYSHILALLTHYIRHSGGDQGLAQSEVVAWYLQQQEAESEADIAQHSLV